MRKIFGNSRHSAHVRGRKGREAVSEPADEGKINGRTRAFFLLGAAVLVFVFVVILCFSLIRQSTELDPLPTTEQKIKPIEYEVNTPPAQPITQGGSETYQIDLKAPTSTYDSAIINILLLGVEEDVNDTIIIASVNTAQRSVAFLSVPRDTYVAGDYQVPKAKHIYGAYDTDRRVAAVQEAVKGMFGFAMDYYFLLEEDTLARMVTLADGVPFEVPASPDYHSLKSGMQTIDEKTAFSLFTFEKSWTDVETDPARVQRDFLQSLLARLLSDRDAIAENCVKISEIARTDLTLEELAYLAYLLADFDFAEAYSRALPGGEKEIDKEVYYEVDPKAAVEMLNENFNPLEKELTVYQVNFRQEQGASGDGEFSDYGHSSSTTKPPKDSETTQGDSEDESDTNTDETTESDTSSEETENTESSETDTPTEEPTEPEASEA